jgi:hypothetical protein
MSGDSAPHSEGELARRSGRSLLCKSLSLARLAEAVRAAMARPRAEPSPACRGVSRRGPVFSDREGRPMSKNVYVGNLPFQTTADDLREAFGNFGTVTRAQVVADRETGRSRGFAFVEMGDGADQAIQAMNGAMFQGRTLTVNEARPREPRAGGFGGGRGR